MSDGELTQDNCTIAIVGKGLPLVILEGDDLKPHIDALKVRSLSIKFVPIVRSCISQDIVRIRALSSIASIPLGQI